MSLQTQQSQIYAQDLAVLQVPQLVQFSLRQMIQICCRPFFRFLSWITQCLCLHKYSLVTREKNHMYVKCYDCGKETIGWDIK
jgi:hypothetical protein